MELGKGREQHQVRAELVPEIASRGAHHLVRTAQHVGPRCQFGAGLAHAPRGKAECDESVASKLVSEMEGKAIHEVVKEGKDKLKNFGGGGGAAAIAL